MSAHGIRTGVAAFVSGVLVVVLALSPAAAHAKRASGANGWGDIFTGGTWTVWKWRAMVGPERFLQVGDVRHAYHRFGNAAGPDLVLLPGFGATKTTWDPAVLDALGKRYHILMPDGRRQGNSTDRSVEPLTMEMIAEAEFELVTALGLDHPILLGHSMGGAVVVHMLQAHGEELGEGILVGSRVTGSDGDPPSPEQLRHIARSGPLEALADLPTLFSPDLQGALAMLSFIFRMAAIPQLAPTLAQNEAQVHAIRDMDSGPVDLESIGNRMLVVVGTSERTVNRSDVVAAADRLPDAVLVELAGAHLCLAQSRSDFVEAVVSFLSS